MVARSRYRNEDVQWEFLKEVRLSKKVTLTLNGVDFEFEATAGAWKGMDQDFPSRREVHAQLSDEVNSLLAHEVRKVLGGVPVETPEIDVSKYGIK